MKLIYNIKVIRIGIAVILSISTLLYYFYFSDHLSSKQTKKSKISFKRFRSKAVSPRQTIPLVKERIVHLDLKGAPPRISYYSKLFPLLYSLGATGLLIEYEDMFPYEGRILNNVAALNAYTLQDIRTINLVARENHLKIIPLIQTFGHLEFVLKLNKFKEYREVWSFPSVICPSFNTTLALIEEMVDQVIEAHPYSDTIHIGCDEVAHLGHCQRCTNRMIDNHMSKSQLYLDHVQSVVGLIRKKYPHLKILAWDDHFRTMKPSDIEKSLVRNSLQPVVWLYSQDVYDELGPSLWTMYGKVFPDLWVASAFKGATGSNKYISDVNHYIQNHKSWLRVISEYQNETNFRGIILTGWQRYDHFAILCELLPVGIPALGMSLRLLKGFKDSPLGPPLEVSKILQCAQPYGLIGSAFGTPKCTFPGGEILENVIHFHQLEQEFDEILEDSRVKGWLNEYNIVHSFSNNQFVKTSLITLVKIKSEVERVKQGLSHAMLEVYDRYTVDEWMETFMKPFEKQVLRLFDAKQNLLRKEVWPRRPLNYNEEL